MIEVKELKDYQLALQMKLAMSSTSNPWSLGDLEKVLKSLKNNKARDDHGHCYEIFKYGGNSLKVSLLNLFNKIKSEKTFPTIMQQANITSLWKRKGDKLDLDNDRGIFNVPKIRSILDKLIYNDIYPIIDLNMSSSNIGARKERNIREHLFVINSIINDIHNSKHSKDIDVQIFDVKKCFDKLDYTDTAINLYNAGVQDDKFVIINESNRSNNVAVKTPWGKTRRETISNIEMQGTLLAGLKCSASIDTIGKEALDNTLPILYTYKNCISIPPLGFIDDVIAISECSSKSVQVCATIKAKFEGKKLELSESKCAHMHISKKKTACPINLYINGKQVKKLGNERYLGDIISSDNKRDESITDRYNKGISYANQIICILKEISLGNFYFEQAIQLRNAILINGMLCSIKATFGLTLNHINKLEQCDRYLMRKIFRSPISTPVECFYLETGTMPLRFVIIARRLLFYWSILHKKDNELVK